jgi:hypothetical protein
MLDFLAVYAPWFCCQCMLAILCSFLAAYGGSAGGNPALDRLASYVALMDTLAMLVVWLCFCLPMLRMLFR